jgi:hypothetical protein
MDNSFETRTFFSRDLFIAIAHVKEDEWLISSSLVKSLLYRLRASDVQARLEAADDVSGRGRLVQSRDNAQVSCIHPHHASCRMSIWLTNDVRDITESYTSPSLTTHIYNVRWEFCHGSTRLHTVK